MGATAVAPEVILGQYEQLTADRANLLDQLETANRKLGALASEKQRLLPRIADGDRSASARADQLDAQKIHGEREVDGLKIKLAEVDAAIAALNEPRRQIYQSRAEENRRKHFVEAREAIETRLYNLQARYRTLCRERFELSQHLFRMSSDGALDEGQRNYLRTLVAQAESALVPLCINERWEHARGPLSEATLRIFPAKPPEDKKALEILK